MKKFGMFAAGVAVLALSITAFAGSEKKVTVEGTLVDGKCYAMNHENTGNDHGGMKGCGTMCLKGGAPAGVVTKDRKFYAILATAPPLADHVGGQVRVSGELLGGSLVPSKLEVSKEGKWEEVKLGASL